MPDRRNDPSALRFLLGHDLRAMRERARMKQSDAGRVLKCSQAKINYLEVGKTQQKPGEVTKLLRAYGADVDHVDRMTSLAGRADQDTWWAPFDEVLPDWFKIFVGLEGLASAEFNYQSMLIPGQLQTPEYAAALLVNNLRVPPMEAAQTVNARIARQRVADEREPLRFRAIIEEYALDRVVGGPTVMRAQLEHLLTLMRREDVKLQVMPVSVTVHDGLDGDFLLLDFDAAQSLGYIEYPTGAIYVQNQDHVAAYNLAAERMCAAALSVPDSLDAINARIAALKTSEESRE